LPSLLGNDTVHLCNEKPQSSMTVSWEVDPWLVKESFSADKYERQTKVFRRLGRREDWEDWEM